MATGPSSWRKTILSGLNDTANFAVVEGFHDTKDEQQALDIGKLWWASFYIACLENKENVCRFDAKPRLHIINKVDWHSILKENIWFLNQRGYFNRAPFTHFCPELDVSLGQLQIFRPTHLFKHLFIVEVTGAGFDKLPNTSYFTLRFPRILEIHQDRTLKDAVSYDELQELAKRAR